MVMKIDRDASRFKQIVRGKIRENLRKYVTHGEMIGRKGNDLVSIPLPQLDVGVHLDEAYRLLMAGHTGVLATEAGKVVDIVTRIDLVQYWTAKRHSAAGV